MITPTTGHGIQRHSGGHWAAKQQAGETHVKIQPPCYKIFGCAFKNFISF